MVAWKNLIKVLDLLADEDEWITYLEKLSDKKYEELRNHPVNEIFDLGIE